MSSPLPWFKFYPSDWRKDPNLSRCSKAAKGFWIDALCLLSETECRGVFRTDGIPWSDEDIALAVGGDIAENLRCLTELFVKSVIARTSDGAVFSRRMVRDEQKRTKCSEAGKRGGGNPTFKRIAKVLPKVIPKVCSNTPLTSDSDSYSEYSSEEEMRITKLQRTLEFDEDWIKFRALCQSCAEHGCIISGDDGAWLKAAWQWASLDGQQRRQAIEGIQARVERELWDDAVLKSLPHNVLENRSYKRPLPRPKTTGRQSLSEAMRNL